MRSTRIDPGSPAETLIDVLRGRAAELADVRAYTYLVDGESKEIHLTYGELDHRAREIGALLQSTGVEGRRAVLLYPPDLEYLAAFFGCLYAGLVAVPAYPPDPARLNRTLPRLQAIIADSQAELVLTTSEILSMAQFLFEAAPDLREKRWVATDGLPAGIEDHWKPPSTRSGSLAFLQYTSGSTGVPKGVMLSHGNLVHNLRLISGAFEIDDASVGVSWLPPYHDMGLIGGILAPLYKGRPTALMSPVAFLQRPLRWLQAITRYKATISGGPNFAYELCIRKINPKERAALDLSTWSLAFTGAEPVRRETLRRFVETFGPCGFRLPAFYPCYGLAEATLIVSGGLKSEDPVIGTLDAIALQHDRAVAGSEDAASVRSLVSCGRSLGDQSVVIVHPESSTVCRPGDVGEIWISGPSVAEGYWGRPDQTEATFNARLADTGDGPFLRTGDLGFLRQGELFITGRLKDLIIVRGRNHYPQDIERSAEESHASLRRGCCAAFAVDVAGEERLIVVVEIERRHYERRKTPSSPPQGEQRTQERRQTDVNAVDHVSAVPTAAALGHETAAAFDPEVVCEAIRAAVFEQHELQAHEVLLLQPGRIPKTSSGKIQRRECAREYLEGGLEQVASSVVRPTNDPTVRTVVGLADVRAAVVDLPPNERLRWLENYLLEMTAKSLKVPRSRLDPNKPVSSFGLDSLMAVELAHRLEKMLGIVVPLTGFLGNVTLAELAERHVVKLAAPIAVAVSHSTAPETRLSHGQRALWFLHELAPESSAYNIACCVQIESEVDHAALARSFEQLANRHRVLCTTYAAGPLQLAVNAPIHFESIDASSWSGPDLERRLTEEAERPFDLVAGPVFRVFLLRTSPTTHVLLLVAHHIAIDLWSLVVLLSELRLLYPAALAGHRAALHPIDLTYTDFVRWQAEMLAGPTGQASWEYWEKELSGDLPILDLPTDRPRPPVQTYRGASHRFALDAALAAQLRDLARMEGATLYVVLLAAFEVLLARYSGQDEFLVGSPAAGRTRAGFDRIVGYFMNPLAFRADLRGNSTFRELVARVRDKVFGGLEHQDLPFALLVERLKPARDVSRSPVFQVMFTLEKAHLVKEQPVSLVALGVPGARTRLGPLTIASRAVDQRFAQFDLSLTVADGGDALPGWFQFNADLFEEATIARMAEHFRVLVQRVVAAPDTRVLEVPLLTAAERELIVARWNETRADYPDRCVHQLFESCAARHPKAPAVEVEGTVLTYGELDRRANQLAQYLKRRGVRAGTLVGICLDRSPDMVVALLGILKTGAAYVPLDPDYPAERLAFMLRDSGATVLVTAARVGQRVPFAGTVDIVRMDVDARAIGAESPVPVATASSARQLAYVIYTSGSTGTPNGVEISHRAVVNFLCSMAARPGMSERDVLLAPTSLSFDIAGLEIYLPLVVGAKVVLCSREVAADGAALGALLKKCGATIMQATPSTWALLVQGGWGPSQGLKVLCGGEALPRQLAVELCNRSSSVWNMYGPTETTIWSAAHLVVNGDVVIGGPIANTQLFILDERLQLVPFGVTGELHISGDGLARGYHERPDLTAAKFVASPFQPGARLYKTGDLGRYRADGTIDLLGRVDHQIKLRGRRIELGEIEAVLAEHPGVREAIVVAAEDERSGRRLMACYSPAGDATPAPGELRSFLAAKLPDYMLPVSYVPLPAFPLTPNGKIDRRALASLEATPDRQTEGRAPRNPLESVVAMVWADALGLERVGVHDDFFALGGHSLLATRAIANMRETLQLELPLRVLFENPTVAGLAAAIAADPKFAEAVQRADLLVVLDGLSEEDAERLLEEHTASGAPFKGLKSVV